MASARRTSRCWFSLPSAASPRQAGSAVPWSVAEKCLGELIAEFGPPSFTARRQSAAYPFTRLRSDGVWTLDRDVPMDSLGAWDSSPITGRLDPRLEQVLKEPGAIEAAARVIVDSQFPMTVAPDVLLAVGLDPTRVFAAPAPGTHEDRRRNSAWPAQILSAWDNQCAFCGYDGHLGSSPVGLEAAHVRWFNLDGPDDLDNGLALCSLHHKLLDRGALGLDDEHRVVVSIASRRGRSPPGASTNFIIVSCALDGAPSHRLSNTRPGISTRSSRVSP